MSTSTPGFATPAEAPAARAPTLVRPSRSLWQDSLRRLARDPVVVISTAYIVLLIVLALFPSVFAPLSYDQTSFPDKLAPPGAVATGPKLAGHVYVLGADRLGRDILSRIIYGTRVSISVAFVGATVSFLIGVSFGLIAGYSHGRVDNIMMRFVDIMYAYPALILIILLQVFLTSVGQKPIEDASPLERGLITLDQATGGMFFVFVAIGAVSWLNMARLTRGQVFHYREQDFVLAAQAIGVPRPRVMRSHLLPNVIGACIVAETLAIPAYIYTEAFLSFVGLGVQPPQPSWGGMIADGYGAFRSAPHIILFPALALCLTMLAFNFLGDAIRDAMDPKMRNRG